ncbi:MAG: hypothetical protein A2X02_08065 [Bacteroidetes bacterium GWF2_29_10]|nr:MAG: hypothetical protein A2X02_08065 [Bacteroidetes bacterium GWF2_29_10]
MGNIRIIIADDHRMIRDVIKTFISSQSDMEIVGEAANGEEVLEMVDSLKPDVVITDITMPKVDGLELIAKLPDNIKIIVLSMHDDYENIISAIEAGANGYIHKNSSQEDLIKAIRSILKGDKYFSQAIAETLINNFGKTREDSKPKYPDVKLSKREIQILVGIANGYKNSQIAEKLFISTRTVDTHRTNIKRKLNAKTTADIVLYAIRNDFMKIG